MIQLICPINVYIIVLSSQLILSDWILFHVRMDDFVEYIQSFAQFYIWYFIIFNWSYITQVMTHIIHSVTISLSVKYVRGKHY